VLTQRMQASGLNPEDYWWYLDLRRYGSVPHAGRRPLTLPDASRCCRCLCLRLRLCLRPCYCLSHLLALTVCGGLGWHAGRRGGPGTAPGFAPPPPPPPPPTRALCAHLQGLGWASSAWCSSARGWRTSATSLPSPATPTAASSEYCTGAAGGARVGVSSAGERESDRESGCMPCKDLGSHAPCPAASSANAGFFFAARVGRWSRCWRGRG